MKSKALIAISLASLFFLPFVSHAACGASKGYARAIDTTTGQVIKTYNNGRIEECGSMMGGSEYFQKGQFSVGQFVCNEGCDRGIKPEKQYIQINGKTLDPQKVDFGEKETCIQAKGDTTRYCWGKGKAPKK